MSAALAVCALYFAVFIAIGFAADRRGSKTAESFYLGDRNFGAVPTALSVGASDSSGWVFTGAVGFAYIYGASMMWICVGYTLGIFCNYVFVAPALRRFTRQTGAASLPHYFALRFPECGARLRLASSALIAVFFTVYAAGQLTSAGKVFEAAGFSYGAAVWAAAFAATFYTFLGGYRAVVWTDVAQGVAILAVLALFPAAFVMQAGGWHAFWAKLWAIDPALLSAGGGHTGASAFAFAAGLASGGLGLMGQPHIFMGQPHILQRFITARDDRSLSHAAVLGVAWVLIQASGSTLLGLSCRLMLPSVADPEFAFPALVMQKYNPIIAGVVAAAVFSAILSTLDSLIVLTAQTVHLDIIEGVCGRKLSESDAKKAARAVIAAAGLVSALAAASEARMIFWFVLYAFAVMGAAFAPPLILSLHWKRTTGRGALCGMLAGVAVSVIWYNVPFLKAQMYEILPAAAASALATAAVSLADGRRG